MPTFHQGTQSNNVRAFTLVELIVVIAIVSVLSTVGFLTYSGYIKNGNDFKRLSDVAMIKTSLESYRKTNGLVYPTGSAATQIVDGSNPLASQYLFDETLCGKAGITTVPRDPKTKTPYLYSVSQDKTNYQVTATLQDDNNLVAMTPFVQTAAAADDGIAYVDGTFIPTNKLLFPGLLYAVTPGAVFNPSLTPSFDISTAQNKAKVILNGQRTNLAYGVPNGQMLAGSGITLEQVLASVSLVERGTSGVASSLCISVENGTSTYAAGENEVWPYMAGTSIGQQIGWKYKTCD